MVELLYTEGCPHAAAYLPQLRRLLAGTGIADPVEERLVTSDEQAQHERFLGSPTVRVGGVDVDPDAEGRLDYGLTCRLYITPDGPRRHPADDEVLSALRRRR